MPPSSSALPLNVTPSATPSRPPTAQATNGVAKVPSATAKPVQNPTDISSPHELTAFVETLLEQLDSNFDEMSARILDQMMQMSSRVDSLEASIQDIINADGPAPPSLPQSPSISQRRSGTSS
ncbi:hypothetical protein NLI96_g10944 [Meripilus lineatus]|uniref:Heat shock factor-binding protein 1 n=1 Tax=Meripilus lineatus TaxID=2056292 RepID=A0AAD5USM6_9APHY|nr:hypothetical protein NLI96_g10944 [Physisporinus lineatus]